MAIRDLQIRSVRVGRIRLGRKVKTSSGKERPSRLDTLRFTSPAQHLVEEVAALYGGEMEVWADAPRGKQWQVVTDATLIPVFIPPQVVDPTYELWSGGMCSRRCDGVQDQIYGDACDCDPEARKCKPTTRVDLLLADVPGLGVWGLETHGYYAAGEMVQLFDMIAGIRVPLPARLLLENRESRQYDRKERKVVTKDYNVPILLLDGVTSRTVQIGSDAVTQTLRLGQEAQAQALRQQAPAIEPPRATAIAAAPAQPPTPPAPDIPRALAAIAKASNAAEMAAIFNRIKETGEVPQLVDAWNARQQALLAESTAAAARQRNEAARAAKEARNARLDAQEAASEATGSDEEAAPPAETPEPPVVDTESPPAAPPATGDDPAARKAAFMSLLGAAGTKKVKTSQLETMATNRFGVALQGLTIAQMDELAGTLE